MDSHDSILRCCPTCTHSAVSRGGMSLHQSRCARYEAWTKEREKRGEHSGRVSRKGTMDFGARLRLGMHTESHLSEVRLIFSFRTGTDRVQVRRSLRIHCAQRTHNVSRFFPRTTPRLPSHDRRLFPPISRPLRAYTSSASRDSWRRRRYGYGWPGYSHAYSTSEACTPSRSPTRCRPRHSLSTATPACCFHPPSIRSARFVCP